MKHFEETEDCVFCKIVAGKSEAAKIYEDDEVLAFLDIAPLIEGHTLVIPKKHYDDVRDMDPKAAAKIMSVVQKVEKRLREKLGAEGFNIINSNGKAAGQTVFHVHFHVVPRRSNDKLGGLGEWWVRLAKEAPAEKLAELASKLRI